jgi:hypothetical protein
MKEQKVKNNLKIELNDIKSAFKIISKEKTSSTDGKGNNNN